MKNNNSRRRSRGNRTKTKVFDSNGPDVRIRGNATQVYDKYCALAKDAQGSGDKIMAENYLQHAEHYLRLMNEQAEAVAQRQNNRQPQNHSRRARQNADDIVTENNDVSSKVIASETSKTQEAAAV